MDDLFNALPENAKRQFNGLAQSPEGKNWICSVCGPMPAKAITLGGKTRYVRQSCECEKAERLKREKEEYEREQLYHFGVRTYSWLGDRWKDLELQTRRFDNFDASRQQAAYDVTQMFLEVMKGSLVLYGTYGTGKTHLLAALCNQYLRDRKKPSLFTTAPKLFSAIQGRIQAKEDYSSLIVAAIKTPLLVIDDVDKAKHSDFREEIYFEIIDERVKAKRPIAISTNKLDELANYVGGAACSRLKIGQMAVEMIGEDYREEMEA